MSNNDLTKLITNTIRDLPSFDDNGSDIVYFESIVGIFAAVLAEVIPDFDEKSFNEECYKPVEKVA